MEEYTISYKLSEAKEYGIVGAVLLNNIRVFTKFHQQRGNEGYWHSMKDLAEMTGFSARQISQASEKLKELGVINYHAGYKPNSTIKTTYWELLNCRNVILESAKSATSESAKSATSIYKSKKLNIKEIGNDTNVSDELKFIHSEICKLFNKSESKYKLSDKRKQKLKSRLKDLGKEGILQACEAITRSEFHMGENQRNWIAEPYWVLENFERAEKWAGEYQNNNKYADLTKLEF